MNEINLTGGTIYRNSGSSLEVIEKAKAAGTDVLFKTSASDSYSSGTEEFLSGYENLSIYQSSASNLSSLLCTKSSINSAIAALQTKLTSGLGEITQSEVNALIALLQQLHAE